MGEPSLQSQSSESCFEFPIARQECIRVLRKTDLHISGASSPTKGLLLAK